MRKQQILIVEDEKLLAKTMKQFLSQSYQVQTFPTVEEAETWLNDNQVDLIISDIRLPGKSGLEFLEYIHCNKLDIPVVFITAYSSLKNAVEAIKMGAVDYLGKPLDLEELAIIVKRHVSERELKTELAYHRRRQRQEEEEPYFIGDSPWNRKIHSIIKRLIAIEEKTGEVPTLLITGESGVGKGALVRYLHRLSPRASQRLVECNCAAIPETLFEAELFGNEKGAFTGAMEKRIGLFEMADNGLLFLDEIGCIPLHLQPKLLKAIEDKIIRRVGGIRDIKVNTRIVAATNADLRQASADGRFRDDLYHRLSLLNVNIPPLRQQVEDIPRLASFFLARAKAKYQCPEPVLSSQNCIDLCGYTWPGNIRELCHEIERGVLLYNGHDLDFTYLAQLPQPLSQTKSDSQTILELPEEGVDLATLEIRVVEQALLQTDRQLEKTANLLNISVSRLLEIIAATRINMDNLRPWKPSLPAAGVDFGTVEKSMIEQALQRTNNNVTAASRLLNLSRDMLRYRMDKLKNAGQ
jgi:DNA-binding NtrC family response regulator